MAADLVTWAGRWQFASTTLLEGILILTLLPIDDVRALALQMEKGLASKDTWGIHNTLRAKLLLRGGRPAAALDLVTTTHQQLCNDESLWVARNALAEAPRPAGDPAVVWLDLHTLFSAWRAHDGKEALRRALIHLERLSGKARAVALPIASRIATSAGDLEVALHLIEEAASRHRTPIIRRQRAILLENLNRMTEAEACARQALEIARATKNPLNIVPLMNDVADWDRVHGRLDQAETGFRDALNFSAVMRGTVQRTVIEENLILILIARADWQGAVEATERLFAHSQEAHTGLIRRPTMLTILALAACHLNLNDRVGDCVVRLESEPTWRLVELGTEGLGFIAQAAQATTDEALSRRLLDLVRRTGPDLFERAIAKSQRGFFG